MHDDRRLVEDRITRVLAQRIRPAQYAASVPLALEVWHVPDEPVPAAQAIAATYEPFTLGTAWGRPWSTSWFRVRGTVPQEWAGRRVEAVFDLGFVGDWPGNQAEALVHDLDGVPVKGVNPQNQYVPIASPSAGGEQVAFLIEAAANPDILANGFIPTLFGDKLTAPQAPLYHFKRADLAVLDEEVWHLGLDVEVLDGLMRQLPTTDPRRHELLRALERCLDVLDIADVAGTASAARAELVDVLSQPANASAHTISAVGHAHIDSAWLWPLRETVRKTARTFANVTALAREYPELVFACSQAQQYAWVRDHQPQIFERIRQAVKTGNWVPVGGMWVECDGNLPGGEALARQLVHGSRLFREEFGVECKGVWLPDSFGYTAAFPQLARLAGMQWFLTQKISWNQTNTFPHHTFWWEGIDGTRVFTHFPPADTYNGVIEAEELAHTSSNYRDAGGGSRSLLPFGHGDGGGGPVREMLERARRVRDLEGSPRVVVSDPDTFFRAAREEYPNAPVWSGELYLELHRGTYTSQARTKAGNRRSEHLLREAELWATTAAVLGGAGQPYEYPYDELDRLWKIVLLHQFHDILPGSSIAWVHREAEATYQQVRQDLNKIITDAAAASRSDLDAGGLSVLNTSPCARTEAIAVPPELAGSLPPPVSSVAQQLAGGALAVLTHVPGSGRVGLDAASDVQVAPVTAGVADGPGRGDVVLDNGLLRLRIDGDGLLASVLDVEADREVLAPGARGNLLQLHTDLPNHWDAWDVDRHYRRQVVDLTEADSVTVIDAGPLVASVRVERSFSASRITQTVRLRAGSRRVDVETEVDWHEAEKFLKAAFPLDVHADRHAAQIQFGHVFRPTHTNTSWDAARFEVYAHRWVHVGEPGYGVAVLNDSTYGHDITRDTRETGGTTTTVRLSLLRAPRSPDPKADQGLHRFTYALLPGAGIGEAVEEGYALNLPVRVVPGAVPEGARPLVEVDGDAICVESVKLADDRSGDVVVRLYECLGGQTRGVLRTAFPLTGARLVDLHERADGSEPLDVGPGGNVALELRPFQVATLRLTRG